MLQAEAFSWAVRGAEGLSAKKQLQAISTQQQCGSQSCCGLLWIARPWQAAGKSHVFKKSGTVTVTDTVAPGPGQA
jgi:hypothetical protein